MIDSYQVARAQSSLESLRDALSKISEPVAHQREDVSLAEYGLHLLDGLDALLEHARQMAGMPVSVVRDPSLQLDAWQIAYFREPRRYPYTFRTPAFDGPFAASGSFDMEFTEVGLTWFDNATDGPPNVIRGEN